MAPVFYIKVPFAEGGVNYWTYGRAVKYQFAYDKCIPSCRMHEELGQEGAI